ncbi:MAG: Asp23/Gls24 family envelope stress response protein, partial [Lawsonibacter sp.]
GVRVKMEDDKVEVELSVLMAYGHTIPEIGKAIQDGVKAAIESMTGLEVAAVNVNVGGITFLPKA